jgi:Na+/melibiose symporter-like transporter
LTFVVYAGLGGVFFLLLVVLQTALGYSPIQAGMMTIPITVILLLLSARSGALAQRIGPRIPLTVGPIIVAVGMLLMRRIEPGSTYLGSVLPAILVFGFGLVLIVAPVTATALTSAPNDQAGLASAVNNAVSRTGQLLAVAMLPVIAGLTGDEYRDPVAITNAFHIAMFVTAGLSLTGSVIAWTMIGADAFEQPPSTIVAGET